MIVVEEHKLLLIPISPQVCMFGPLLFRNSFMHDFCVKGSVHLCVSYIQSPPLPRQFNAEQRISNQSGRTKCFRKVSLLRWLPPIWLVGSAYMLSDLQQVEDGVAASPGPGYLEWLLHSVSPSLISSNLLLCFSFTFNTATTPDTQTTDLIVFIFSCKNMGKLLQNCVVSLIVSLGCDNDGKNVPL